MWGMYRCNCKNNTVSLTARLIERVRVRVIRVIAGVISVRVEVIRVRAGVRVVSVTVRARVRCGEGQER